jgi:putative transcriptional regulator
MGVYTSLKDHFLIAMPQMTDPNFSHSVIYICEHSPQGAMGIVINLPLSIHLDDVFNNMKIHTDDKSLANTPVLAGGPIQKERGFVIHKQNNEHWESSLELNADLCITTSKDILEAIASHQGPNDIIIALGYAGWESGQLEREIQENSWLCGPADSKILFDVPAEHRWKAAGLMLGVDMDCLSYDVGHA